MKAFDQMSPQRQAAHALFDNLLDLRVEMIRHMVAPGFKPEQMVDLENVLRDQEIMVDGAKEVVCLTEIVERATTENVAAIQNPQPPQGQKPANKAAWPPQPKI